jgi:uncharacterized BrkB/YihY/UPF0761 family membrane protein
MFKKCQYCGFKNPVDVGDCLACHRDLPDSTAEIRQAFQNLKDVTQGNIADVGTRVAKNIAQGAVSSAKYQLNPVWIIKVKLHHLKQTVVSIFWFFAIIGAIVIIGLIYNFLRSVLIK